MSGRRWAALERCPEQRARPSAADEILSSPPGTSVAIGLPGLLAAVNACAVQTLIVPEDGLVPGYECGRCGALSTDADSCPDWGTAALPVPDVIEEMVTRALEDGAQIWVIRGTHSPVAARLYFPVAARGLTSRPRAGAARAADRPAAARAAPDSINVKIYAKESVERHVH